MGYTIFWDQHTFTDYSYDNVVKVIEKVIDPSYKFRLESWGFLIENAPLDGFAVSRNPNIMTFSKTNRLPYTIEAMKALIVMVEFGAATNLGHDDSDMSLYIEALDSVHSKHPLLSYEAQKDYFTTHQRHKYD